MKFTTHQEGCNRAVSYTHLDVYKRQKEPFQWILNREKPNGSRLFYTNLTVGMEDYQITDDAEEGFDITVAVSLKPVSYTHLKQRRGRRK